MAHENRTQPDATWIPGYSIPRADFESLDAKQFRGLNGDLGGAHAPTAQILFNGAQPVTVSGPTLVRGDGVLTLDSTLGIVFGDGDYQDLAPGHAGRERELLQSTLPFMVVGAYPGLVAASRQYASAQPLALNVRDSLGNDWPIEFLCSLRVHDGARLDKVTFTFRVPVRRNASPAVMPQFRVFRRDVYGNVAQLKATTLGDGLASPDNPGSANLWFHNGDAQTFEYVCDQNNVIDIASYVYFAHVVEESGATSFPMRLPIYTDLPVISASTGSVNDLTPDGPWRGQCVFDGVTSGYSSNPFLFKDASYPPLPFAELGLYRSGSGAAVDWPRAVGFDTSQGITDNNGALIPIAGGTSQSDTLWQMTVPTPSFVLGKTKIAFGRPEPRGNLYHSMLLSFSGIVDTRFQ